MTTQSELVTEFLVLTKKADWFFHDLKRDFFKQWLRDHFGSADPQRILTYLRTLDKAELEREVGLVADEYEWCKTVSDRRVEMLR